VRETNATVVSDQLAALGHDRITSIHHEALRLPSGHTVFLGSVERILTDVQGPGPVTALADMIVAIDPNWRVSWAETRPTTWIRTRCRAGRDSARR
jgi:hypothetical protein